MATAVSISYSAASGAGVHAGRYAGGRLSGAPTLGDVAPGGSLGAPSILGGNVALADAAPAGGLGFQAVWDATIGLTVLALPSSVSAGSSALLASGSRALDFYGGFTAHQGMVYFPPLRAMICFGAETHGNTSYYTNSPRIIELDTMRVSRALPDDPFSDFRIDDAGIPWGNAAHTAPWAMHGFRQQFIKDSELWVVYNAIKHANLYEDLPGSIIPVDKREGAATTVRACIWIWNPITKGWRYVDGGANNAVVAAMEGVGYSIVHNPARNSIMGNTGTGWREMSLSDYSQVGSTVSVPISSYNNYSLLLDDGRVLTGAGGDTEGTLFSLVAPANPSAYTQVLKSSYSALSGLSTRMTPWVKLPSGKVLGFLKDVAGGLLRPFIFNPTDLSFTDTGHSINVGAAAAADTNYWHQADWATDFGVAILANAAADTLRVWAYKPSAGV